MIVDRELKQKRCRELADLIEPMPHHPSEFHPDKGKDPEDVGLVFNLARFRFHCGAPACIAGHANELYGGRDHLMPPGVAAGEVLGLAWHERDALFYAADESIDISDVPPVVAAEVLRHFADTGEISYRDAAERLGWSL